jgi:cellobiose phosphorylase
MTTVFSGSCVYYITETSGMRFSVRVFPDKENTLHFTLGIENLSQKAQQLFISSFLNPFLRHDLFEGAENRWFREVRLIQPAIGGSDLGSFMIKANEDLSRTESVSNIAAILRLVTLYGNSRIISHEETASRYEYVGGIMNNLSYPYPLYSGHLPVKKTPCAFTETGAAGDIIHFGIGPGSMARYDIEFKYKTHCVDEKDAELLFAKPFLPAERDNLLVSLENESIQVSNTLAIEFAGESKGPVESGVLNSFFYHLMKQVKFCSLIKGYVQLSPLSMIGIRDVFQALEAYMFWEPSAARRKMLEALNFVLEDGRCPRQYTLPVKKGAPAHMDLRPFIDQGSWVISAVSTYLKLTGDMGFLNESCGYCRADEEKGVGACSEICDSVLDHLIRIMDYLLKNRDFGHTGLIRALYGDWNDALDGLGVSNEQGVAYGTGVSVMASLHVYQNLAEIIGIIEKAKNELQLSDHILAKIPQYSEARDVLETNILKYAVVKGPDAEKRIVHGWGDKRSYLVGGFCDPDGRSRYSLTSNAFWVLSGIYEKSTEMKNEILKAFNQLDSKYGFRTFEPYFPSNCPGVGRIPKLPRGTAENGAVYIHASTFAVMALFKMGLAKEAWNQIFKLLPVTHHKISCSPYVMPNSYGYNDELNIDGESMSDWQTGSSNVLFKIFIRFVLGIEPDHDHLMIQPANWYPFEEFRVNIKIRSCLLRLHYKKSGVGNRKFYINGRVHEGKYNQHMKTEYIQIPWNQLNMRTYDILTED